MTVTIGRRELLAALGGAAAAWPLAARAQQPGKLPTIGFLGSTRSATSEWTTAFVQRLRELGWIDGRNVAIKYRWGEGRNERFAQIAAEFVRLKVDLIVTGATPPTIAAKQATSVIPIVFAVAGDPVGTGLVASLARPGGNATGLSTQPPRACRQAARSLARGCPPPSPVGNHGQCRQSPQRAGVGRGSGGGSHARSRSPHSRNPASAGYRARHRGAQWPRRRTLCLYRRAREHQWPRGCLRCTGLGSTSNRAV
jgi:hypothetical protein